MNKKNSKRDRKYGRLNMSLSATVKGCNDSGDWVENVKTVDISVGGIAVRMNRAVELEMVVLIELPFPIKIKMNRNSKRVTSAYAVVKRVEMEEDGQRLVGLEFIEKPAYVF